MKRLVLLQVVVTAIVFGLLSLSKTYDSLQVISFTGCFIGLIITMASGSHEDGLKILLAMTAVFLALTIVDFESRETSQEVAILVVVLAAITLAFGSAFATVRLFTDEFATGGLFTNDKVNPKTAQWCFVAQFLVTLNLPRFFVTF